MTEQSPIPRTRGEAVEMARSRYRVLGARVGKAGLMEPDELSATLAAGDAMLAEVGTEHQDAVLRRDVYPALAGIFDEVAQPPDRESATRWLDLFPTAVSRLLAEHRES